MQYLPIILPSASLCRQAEASSARAVQQRQLLWGGWKWWGFRS